MAQRIENRAGKNLFEKTGTEVIKPRLRRTLMAPFGITGLKIEPVAARSGQPVTISFDALNATDFTSIYPVALKINDEVVAAEVVSLPRNTIMPMKFTVTNTIAGVYDIDVNDATGRFTVTAEGVEQHLASLAGVKPDLSQVEAESHYSVPKSAVAIPQKPALSIKPLAPSQAEPQEVINTVAGGIETGLDRIGDGIIVLIDKVISAPGALLRRLKRK